MNTISILARIGLCSGLTLALTGCMSSAPVYDKHFGEAVRTVRVMQTLNPNASMSSDPVSGVDGHAVMSAMDRYNTQYHAPRSDTSAFTVGASSSNSLDSMGKRPNLRRTRLLPCHARLTGAR